MPSSLFYGSLRTRLPWRSAMESRESGPLYEIASVGKGVE